MITSYPIDITASAEACYAESEQMDSYGIVATISRYLSEERERCAKLIEDGFNRGVGGLGTCDHGKFRWEDCDQCCADAIRRPPPVRETP